MKKFSAYEGVVSGFFLDFRKTDNTYFLSIQDFEKMIEQISKKSFNEQDMMKYSNPIIIEKKKLKVNYRYNITGLLDTINDYYKVR